MMFRCRSDAALSFTYADDGAEAVTGYTPSELVDTGLIFLPDLIHPEDRDSVRSRMQGGISDKKSFIALCRLMDKERKYSDGIIIGTALFRGALTLTGLEGYIIRINPGVSCIKSNKTFDKEPDALAKDEKLINLAEIDRYIQKINEIIRQKQDSDSYPGHDMRYCALLMDTVRLISNQNLDNKGLQTEIFLSDLSELIKQTYSVEIEDISVSLSNVLNEQLSGYQGLCIGIIVCEQFCNVIGYAFNAGQTGMIELSFIREEDWLILQIRDNGKGFPDSVLRNKNTSGGLALMEQLSNDLLGTVSLLNDNGAVIRVIFPADGTTS